MVFVPPKIVEYELMSGSLPDGLYIDNGVISGRISWASSDVNLPIWITESGKLAELDERTELIPVQIQATTDESRLPILYSIVDNRLSEKLLPWGLQLNAVTGVISGTTAELVSGFLKDPALRPHWLTPSGYLGTYETFDPLELVFQAEIDESSDDIFYILKSGEIPFGLTLDMHTGVLSGTIVRNGDPNADISPKSNPPIIHLDNDELIFTAALGDSIDDFEIKTTIHTGRELSSVSVKPGLNNYESLPFGLKLFNSTISGTISITAPVGTYNILLYATDKSGGYSEKNIRIEITDD